MKILLIPKQRMIKIVLFLNLINRKNFKVKYNLNKCIKIILIFLLMILFFSAPKGTYQIIITRVAFENHHKFFTTSFILLLEKKRNF